MKLLLFLLGITLITTQFVTDSSFENTEGIIVSGNWEEDENVITDDWSWLFEDDLPNNGECTNAVEEECLFPSEEEILVTSPSVTVLEDLLTQVRNDPVASGVLDFGVDAVIAAGVAKGKIPNVPFTVTSISGLTKTTSDEGNLYDFSCQAVSEKNGNSSSVIEMNFTVYYDFHSKNKTLSSYSYVITTTTTIPVEPSQPENEYVQVSEAEIETDAVVHSVLEYGAAQIYAIGTQAGKIPVSEFAIKDVVSVWKQVTATGANYKCEVVLGNANKATIVADFTIAYNAATQNSTLTAYKYTISIVDVPLPPVDNTTNTTTGGFVALSNEEIHSAEVLAVLDFGSDQVLNSGYAKGKIPVSDSYKITRIDGVFKKEDSNRTTYRCDVLISGTNKVKIDTVFDVYVTNGNFSIGGWAYNATVPANNTNTNTTTPTQPGNNTNTNTTTPVGNSTNTTTGAFVALSHDEIYSTEVLDVLDFGTDQILARGYSKGKIPVSTYKITRIDSVLKKVDTNRTTYRCDVVMTGTNKVKVDTVFDVYVKNGNYSIGPLSYNVSNIPATPGNNTNTNTTTPTNPTNNTGTNTTTPVGNNTNTTTGGFVALSNAEIHSAEVLDVLDFGTDQILDRGYAKGKIPVSTYKITRIDSVLRKVDTNRTTYRCDVVMTGTNKVKVDTVFDVYVTNGNYSIGGLSYNVSNIPATPGNNTNTNTTTPTQPTNNTNTNTTTPTNPTDPVGNTTNPSTGGFVALTNAEIHSAEVLDVLDFGTDQVLDRGYTKGKIPVSTYKITHIDSVLKKVETNRTTYRCDVVMTGTNKVKVDTVFDVYAKNGNYTIGPLSYNVSNIPVTPTNNTNTTTPTQPTNNTSTNITTPTNPTNNTNTNTTTPTNPTTGFVALSNAEIHSAEVLDVLDFGTDQVLDRGYSKGKIPVSTYKITRIDSVLKQVETNRTTYRCDVVMTGTNKVKVDAVFDVYAKNGNYTIGPLTYNVSNIPVAPTNNTAPTTPTQPTNNTNTNPTTPTQPTKPTNNTNTNTTAPTVPTSPNATDSNFTALTAAQIQTAEVQSVLSYGSDQIIQKGIAKGKIPVSVYSINKVNSVAVNTQATQTVYKCNVELLGANKLFVRTEYNVYVNATTQAKSLGPFSYATAWA